MRRRWRWVTRDAGECEGVEVWHPIRRPLFEGGRWWQRTGDPPSFFVDAHEFGALFGNAAVPAPGGILKVSFPEVLHVEVPEG